ncbi:MAG: efflux RND transporter periplasmic adaptor subunit [Planctomycetales bacterium]|nr:efflux RND transporter periplasmic adaptor subunit [Planctomycetales bacterium]
MAPTTSRFSLRRLLSMFGACAVLLLAAVIGQTWLSSWRASHAAQAANAPTAPSMARDADGADTLTVPEESVRGMKLATQVVARTTQTKPLRLTGQLMLDPSRLVHVSTRFDGEVVRIEGSATTENAAVRPLHIGDRVQKGQLLAVLWSKEIGEKKSDLVDAISQLALHQANYKNLKSLEKSGGVPQRTIDEMRQTVESNLIQVERLRRTLRSWRLDEADLKEAETEAQRIHAHASAPPDRPTSEDFKADPKVERTWAEIDIRSPMDGVILEMNLAIGDIVKTSDDLFKVADLSRLIVTANAYEEDLPELTGLTPERRKWTVQLISRPQVPEVTGQIEMIGNVIDPNQHTAVVQGWIDNALGELRVGQFVEAVVQTPQAADLAELPSSGLLDDGAKKFVFVALDDKLTRVQRREVRLTRRTASTVFVSSEGDFGVRPGERVLVRGQLELAEVWNQLQNSSSK